MRRGTRGPGDIVPTTLTAVPGSSDTTAEELGQTPMEQAEDALLLLLGRLHGGVTTVQLGSESPLLLGRDDARERHVRLDDPRASRQHAEVHWSELHRRHWIKDLGSRNGTFVNGVRVSRATLRRGDLVRLGGTVFRVGPAPAEGAPDDPIAPPFVGASRSLRQTIERATRFAGSDAPVLILGPTGTGKELVAGAIHHRSTRRTGPFVVLNCAALPAHLVESELFGHEKGAFSGADSARLGLFRAARGGTLFLDEVGELPGPIQAKLLRALDVRAIRPLGATAEMVVDTRVVAATNRDLRASVDAGRFRPDLYARLVECVVEVAPLRDRPEDLQPLWRHFVAELGGGVMVELTAAAFEAMALHPWPFNVRELRQLVRHALLVRESGGQLVVDDLPAVMRPPRDEIALNGSRAGDRSPLLASGEVPNAQQLRRLAEEFHGNVKDMAAFLGKDRKQVYRWLRRGAIDPAIYRRSGA
jgi:sigma-54 dependent transcriptional regulator, acetoin dehydrogenase operon transcriptional activator AcoR